MDNFDLRKYLIENKATLNSRIFIEAYITPQGDLGDFKYPDLPSSGNPDLDQAFDELIFLASDTSDQNNNKPGTNLDLEKGLDKLGWMHYEVERYILLSDSPEAVISDVVEPTTELGIAYLKTLKATHEEDPKLAIKKFGIRLRKLQAMYDRFRYKQ
jgi:hypothetical protein